MDFHGDINKMLPKGKVPDKNKKCMRMDNWELTDEYHSGRGGSSVEYYIDIK